MKIAFISTLYYPEQVGGAEKVVRDVAEGLVELGHECHVITLGRASVKRCRELSGVRIHEIPVRNLYWPFIEPRPKALRRAAWHALDTMNPWMASSVGELLDQIRPDVVNSHNIAGFSVSVWSAVKQRNIPLMHTMHDQYLLCPSSTMFKKGRNCEKQCGTCRVYSAPRISRSILPDLVTGVSQFILDRHRHFGCFEGVPQKVIYNSYEPPKSGSDNEPRHRLSGPIRFGFLGRVHESKGIGRLLEAFMRLPEGSAELYVAGTGDEEYLAELRGKSSERKDIYWLGFVAPEDVLSQVDIVVIPSLWHDTAPLVTLEALAWGRPLMVSNRGGLPELVPEGAGWIFDPDNVSDLTKLLRRCSLQRSGIRESSLLENIKGKSFSRISMLGNYSALFSQLIEASGS